MTAPCAHTEATARWLVDEVQALDAFDQLVLQSVSLDAPDELDAFQHFLADLGRLEGPGGALPVAQLIAAIRGESRWFRLAYVGAVLGDQRPATGAPRTDCVLVAAAGLVAAVEAEEAGWAPPTVVAVARLERAAQETYATARQAIVRAEPHLLQPEPLRPLWAAIEGIAGTATNTRMHRGIALDLLVMAAQEMAPDLRRGWAAMVRSGQLDFPPARAFLLATAAVLDAVSAEADP